MIGSDEGSVTHLAMLIAEQRAELATLTKALNRIKHCARNAPAYSMLDSCGKIAEWALLGKDYVGDED